MGDMPPNTEHNGHLFHDRRKEGRRNAPTWTATEYQPSMWSHTTSVMDKRTAQRLANKKDPEQYLIPFDPALHEAMEGGTPTEGWPRSDS